MAWISYLNEVGYAGAFLGFNVDRDKTPFTIIGAPLDISTSFRGGSAMAPDRIRFVSKSLELCSIMTDIDMESIGFEDIGNIAIAPGDILESMKRIEKVIEGLLDNNRILFILGGEHTVTLPSFRSLARKSSKPCLLVFDAHTDLRDEYTGSKYNHATVIKRVIDETNAEIIVVGARAVSREELETYHRIADRIEIIRLWRGIETDIHRDIRGSLDGCRDLYISIDMDILDPSYAPGVQTPEPLGIEPVTLLNILRKVIDSRVRVVDVVEVTPQFDIADITSFLAAKIVIEAAAIIYTNISDRYDQKGCKW